MAACVSALLSPLLVCISCVVQTGLQMQTDGRRVVCSCATRLLDCNTIGAVYWGKMDVTILQPCTKRGRFSFCNSATVYTLRKRSLRVTDGLSSSPICTGRGFVFDDCGNEWWLSAIDPVFSPSFTSRPKRLKASARAERAKLRVLLLQASIQLYFLLLLNASKGLQSRTKRE
jgi:hypothetical protein